MLVLTRKPGEAIQIGPSVRVTVIAAGKGWVRLGFDAPPEVNIVREEVLARCPQTRELAVPR